MMLVVLLMLLFKVFGLGRGVFYDNVFIIRYAASRESAAQREDLCGDELWKSSLAVILICFLP